MTSLVNCPHCSTRVLPMAGRICPSCRNPVDVPPEPVSESEPAGVAVYNLAAEQMQGGLSPSRIETNLTRSGVDPRVAASVVGQMTKARADDEAGRRNMIFGALWCFGGIAGTVLTYKAASSGGTFMVFWGAILFGGIQFFRGLAQSAPK